PGRVEYRHGSIAVLCSAGAEAAFELPGEPALGLRGHLSKVEAVDESMDSNQCLGLFARAVDALADVNDADPSEPKALQDSQRVGQVTGHAATVVHEDHVERWRRRCGCGQERLQAGPSLNAGAAHRRIGVGLVVLPREPMALSVLAT